MDLKKVVAIGLLALTVLTFAAPAAAWIGPFGGWGCGFGWPFGLFARPVPVPVPVPVAAAPLCAPGPCGLGVPGLGFGGCGLGAPGLGLGLGLGGCGFGNNLAIPGPC